MFLTKSSPPSIQFDETWDEPKWNPDIHLNIQAPKNVVLLHDNEFPTHPVPCPAPTKRGDRSQLAYSEPFQFLSPLGVAALRKVIDHNMKHVTQEKDARIPMYLTMMGYRSRFIHDMNTCPKTLAFLSSLAGVKLIPSAIQTTWGHTNIGVIGKDAPVDQWHVDSVPFVLVILLSDMSGADGGRLEVVKRAPYQTAFKRIIETRNNVPKEEVLVVEYPTQGCAILMQGSQMVHHVSPVISAKERRITVVNSYQPRDPFYPVQDTRMDAFKKETETISYLFARNRAANARGKLQAFLDRPEWISDPIPLARELKQVSEELDEAVKLLTGVKSDVIPYVQEMALQSQATQAAAAPSPSVTSSSSRPVGGFAPMQAKAGENKLTSKM